MPTRFPSFEFVQQLQKGAEQEASRAANLPTGGTLVGLDLDGHPFMIEFEDGVYVAAAPGGNPNDLDFSPAAPRDTWLELFERISSRAPSAGPHPLAKMVGADRPIRLEAVHDDGAKRFASYRPALEAFFDGSLGLMLD